MTQDTTYSKKSTGGSPFFGGKKADGTYASNPGRINTPHDGPAGGEVRRDDILGRGGRLIKE
jgi:hypothetical protein